MRWLRIVQAATFQSEEYDGCLFACSTYTYRWSHFRLFPFHKPIGYEFCVFKSFIIIFNFFHPFCNFPMSNKCYFMCSGLDGKRFFFFLTFKFLRTLWGLLCLRARILFLQCLCSGIGTPCICHSINLSYYLQ